ncbi:ROK family protein [Actinomadura viridis]|uniref:NBD/HSP70 family sugar kinase n=1 Tax=Actinomadura viridis TaxID=58110 RepID=A0A931DTZ3_9ACTN|nr:ROK family transcriptional regulator [Actinomadura viridis]MBG6093821.1 putative NBD/HSP70 family sugar kinase [Actinomadura viridis]
MTGTVRRVEGGDMPQVSAPSAGQLLQFVRQGRARTRRDLMELTGLSRSTVAQRVEQLVSAGYLREGGVDVSTGGRRPSLLRIDEGSAVVLAAHLGATHGRAAVVDLSGRTLAESAGRLSVADGVEPTLAWAASRFHGLLAEAGRSMAEVCGVGLGLPCPVDRRTGRVIPTPMLSAWGDHDIVAALSAQFPGPILADNDANMMALGEFTAIEAGCPTLVLVKVGTGIGAGIVEEGRVLHGAGGAAGEIGHIRLRGHDDVLCGCGAHGCLAAVASGAALARDLGRSDPSVRETADVVRLVQAGDAAAVRRTREAGRVLGEVLATLVSVTNPGVLVVSGALARTGEHLLSGIREVVHQVARDRSTRGLRIVEGRLGERAGVIGAASMVVDRVLAAEAVDARIAGPRLPVG